jgi:hypothetical protein
MSLAQAVRRKLAGLLFNRKLFEGFRQVKQEWRFGLPRKSFRRDAAIPGFFE